MPAIPPDATLTYILGVALLAMIAGQWRSSDKLVDAVDKLSSKIDQLLMQDRHPT